MYTVHNFKTKKAFKEAVEFGDVVCQLGNDNPFPNKSGKNCQFEGPHYPQAHTWYAAADVVEENGVLLIKQGSKVK